MKKKLSKKKTRAKNSISSNMTKKDLRIAESTAATFSKCFSLVISQYKKQVEKSSPQLQLLS